MRLNTISEHKNRNNPELLSRPPYIIGIARVKTEPEFNKRGTNLNCNIDYRNVIGLQNNGLEIISFQYFLI